LRDGEAQQAEHEWETRQAQARFFPAAERGAPRIET
jgi:hypothetical protein